MHVLPARIFLCEMCAWFPQMAEEGVASPGIGAKGDCEIPSG